MRIEMQKTLVVCLKEDLVIRNWNRLEDWRMCTQMICRTLLMSLGNINHHIEAIQTGS